MSERKESSLIVKIVEHELESCHVMKIAEHKLGVMQCLEVVQQELQAAIQVQRQDN